MTTSCRITTSTWSRVHARLERGADRLENERLSPPVGTTRSGFGPMRPLYAEWAGTSLFRGRGARPGGAPRHVSMLPGG